jgi:Flp pilus assembly protein protease CpaA
MCVLWIGMDQFLAFLLYPAFAGSHVFNRKKSASGILLAISLNEFS